MIYWKVKNKTYTKFMIDSIDHTILLNIIRENFQDNRFINLISMLLKAGYLEDWKFNATLSGCTRFSYWSDF